MSYGNPQPTMVFAAHRVQIKDKLLDWWPALHYHPYLIWFLYPFWPVIWPVLACFTLVYFFQKQGYDVVDTFQFGKGAEKIIGQIILLKNYGWHYMMPNGKELMRQRTIDMVTETQERIDPHHEGKASIILGALLKDEKVTKGGKDVDERTKGIRHVSLHHGNKLTAMVVVQWIVRLWNLGKLPENFSIFLTGATSKIGRAFALKVIALIPAIKEIKMFTTSQKRFEAIREEAPADLKHKLVRATSYKEMRGCHVVITGKGLMKRKERRKLIRQLFNLEEETYAGNFAVPTPIPQNTPKNIHQIEMGVLAVPLDDIELGFLMRLKCHRSKSWGKKWVELYPCFVAGILAAWRRIKGIAVQDEIGEIAIDEMDQEWKDATDLGFRLPPMEFFEQKKIIQRIFQLIPSEVRFLV